MLCCVIQLTQNCQKYYENDFPLIFKAFRTALGANVEWFFIENDSVDKTSTYAAKYGHVLSISLPKIVSLASRCTSRTDRMSFLRNKALQWVNQFGSYDYYIWLDTNVKCDVACIKKLYQTISSDVRIGLAGANTLEIGRAYHYYDTYALDSTSCLWKQCHICNGPHSKTDIVDVKSAFGGLCFIRGDIQCTFAATFNQCEHIYMCTKLREKGYRIVIVGPAEASWKN